MMTNQWLNLHLGFALDVNCELQGALQRGEQIVRGSLCAFGVWTRDSLTRGSHFQRDIGGVDEHHRLCFAVYQNEKTGRCPVKQMVLWSSIGSGLKRQLFT